MKVFKTLISVEALDAIINDVDCLVLDCSKSPEMDQKGRGDYLSQHLPGALHVHLDHDLASPVIPGKTGRHPLPEVNAFTDLLSRLGVGEKTQIIAYDHSNNMVASRLWWLVKWGGHDAVAVLDGGLLAWKNRGLLLESGEGALREPTVFKARLRPEMVASADDVSRLILEKNSALLDARSAERFRGENETYDPIAGHIPGAACLPFTENLDKDGFFLPKDQLLKRFQPFINNKQPVFYCGSGVSACHNILAWQHAGLGDVRLYVGSWSEWITDPTRPLADSQ